MLEQHLFSIAFLCQIILVSIYVPSRISRRMTHIFARYPPSTHPLLYPKPLEDYLRQQRRFRLANAVIAVAWLLALLKPRRLFDVLSPSLFWTTVFVYVAFWVFVAWFRQFDYPWFGGFINNLIISGLNIFFASILLWFLYGKKLNPHQSNEDRMRIIRRLATVLCLVSIAVTLYAVVTIYLSAGDARAYQPVARSVYFQLIILLSVQTYRIDRLDFDVYREGTRTLRSPGKIID